MPRNATEFDDETPVYNCSPARDTIAASEIEALKEAKPDIMTARDEAQQQARNSLDGLRPPQTTRDHPGSSAPRGLGPKTISRSVGCKGDTRAGWPLFLYLILSNVFSLLLSIRGENDNNTVRENHRRF